MPAARHPRIRQLLRDRYTPDEVRQLRAELTRAGTLDLTPLPTGLYPAVAGAASDGYHNVWVRDNVHVAAALREAGRTGAATAIARAIATFYSRHRHRFADVIAGRVDPAEAMARPHIRFDGRTLRENPERWAHAQNDALGAFLWLYCRFVRYRLLAADDGLLTLLPRYFAAIRYWQDADSGHWEERRKVQASSLGPVVAGLCALRELRGGDRGLEALTARGEQALDAILPAECAQPDARLARRHDAALLFLVHPFDVVDEAMARRIVDDVRTNLQGEHGIRRYLGDSYWTADFAARKPPESPDVDEDGYLDARDALARPGEEAQWCLFDPIVSVIAGRWYERTREPADLALQVRHLNRSLAQLTPPDAAAGGLRCPEAYCLVAGSWVPNDHVPLLWTQANLLQALLAMERSAVLAGYSTT